VVFEWYDGSILVQTLKFDTVVFWIQLHNLPHSLLNIETARSLGESIGVVFYPRDPSEMKGCNFMRVRVAVDISNPLCRGCCVTWNQGSDEWIAFKYERLLNLCYWCGLMSHDDC